MKERPGPTGKRENFDVLGKYLDDALSLAHMSQTDLAKAAGLKSSSYVSRVLKGERDIDRATLLRWCQLLHCPAWLEERILNAAGYASEQQLQAVSTVEMVEQTHQAVLNVLHEREQYSE